MWHRHSCLCSGNFQTTKQFLVEFLERAHLRAIGPAYRALIRMTLEQQLRFQPDKETGNRKPLQRPAAFEAMWELRFGPENRFRVFSAVSHERQEVRILAIGTKHRNRLTIGREEIKL